MPLSSGCGDDLALVLTTDFFTPIVDDPYDFGAIAAANALSDVYAMGGTPLSALNLVGFPDETLDASILTEILRGGAEKAREAGIDLLGGHTIKTDEPIYGLAVTGTVHPDRVVTNAGGKPGDLLVLTKAIGVGVIVTIRGEAGQRLAPTPAGSGRRIRAPCPHWNKPGADEGDDQGGGARGDGRDRLRAARPPAEHRGGERLQRRRLVGPRARARRGAGVCRRGDRPRRDTRQLAVLDRLD